MFGGKAGEGGFSVLDVAERGVAEEEGGVVGADEDAGKGAFAVEGAGGGLEG